MNIIYNILCILPILLSCFADDKYCDDRSWLKFNDNCYTFGKERLSFYDAEDFCRSKGSHLVSIHSEDEHQFILNQVKSDFGRGRRWIGLTVAGVQKNYQWSDGTEVDFLKIAPKTQYVKEKCHIFYQDEGWRTEHCELRYTAICKKSVNDVTPSPIPPLTTLAPEGNCPPNWLQFNQKCFKFFGEKESEKLQYKEAKNACLKMGEEYDLASIHSMEEQAFLVQELANFNSSAWIGLTHIESDEIGHITVFGWTDNSRVDFTNWAVGHPKPGTWKYCARLNYEGVSKGQWISDYCSNVGKFGYICSRTPASTFPPQPPKPSSNCPEGFSGYRTACYKYYSNEETWENAEETCSKQDGHIVSITDSFEEAYLYNFLKDTSSFIWSGLKTIKGTRIFQWADFWPFYYSNWEETQPQLTDINTSACTIVSTETQKWNVTSCTRKMPFVCKTSSVLPPSVLDYTIGECKTNEKQLIDVGDEYCYHVGASKNDRLQWGQVNRYCMSKGMEMISIHSKDQLDTLMAYLWKSPYDYWLGLIRSFDRTNFMWMDNSDVDYTNWDKREPQSASGNLDCAGFSTETSKWSVKDCSNWLGSICRIKKDVRF